MRILIDTCIYIHFAIDRSLLSRDDCLPETVLMDMPCEYCRTKGYFTGYGNPQCKTAIRVGKCALCIDAISVETVKEKIDTLLSV